MDKEQKEIVRRVFEYNTYEYNAAKLAEELQELSLELTKLVTKPDLDETRIQAIIDEIGDVKIRLKVFELSLDRNRIEERVHLKLVKFNTLLENKRYKYV